MDTPREEATRTPRRSLRPCAASALPFPSNTQHSYYVEANKDFSHLVLMSALEQRGWSRLEVTGGSREKTQKKGAKKPRSGSGWAVVRGVGRTQVPNFVWAVSEADVDWHAISAEQAVNHFPCVGALTTKAGLCATLRDLHWWTKADHRTFFPRCHQLVELGERRAFAADFRRTAAATVLRLHCTLRGADFLPRLPCAPRLVAIALRVVEEWVLDLEHHLPPPAPPAPAAPPLGVGGGSVVGGGEGDNAAEDVLEFASGGVPAWQWAELLDYSYALIEVADAAEAHGRAKLLAPVKGALGDEESAAGALHKVAAVFAALTAQSGAEPGRTKKPPSTTAGTATYRPPGNGIPSLREIAPVLIKPETASLARSRQLWADPVPFTDLVLTAGPCNRVGAAAAVGAPAQALCARALAQLAALWPQAGIDGCAAFGELPRNAWIVKAPSASRGTGIELERRLKPILVRSGGMGGRVVQKYIETPLLTPTTAPTPTPPSLHGSKSETVFSPGAVRPKRMIPRPLAFRRNGLKFDLRMWVLLVGASRSPGCSNRDLPSECYVFEPCYARRCSHAFSLAATSFKDRLAHLSNYSVQKKGLASDEDAGGDDLLWTEEELLSAPGVAGTCLNKASWESRVKPSLRRLAGTLAAAVLPAWSDESLGGRAQCFELVGLDVMLDDELNPWLLEANMTPGLSRRNDTNPTHCRRIVNMLNGIVRITTSRWFDPSVNKKQANPYEPNSAPDGDWLKVYSAPAVACGNIEAQREARTNADALCVTGKRMTGPEMSAHEDVSKRRQGISMLANVGVPKMVSRWRCKHARLASAAVSIQCLHRRVTAVVRTQRLRRVRAARCMQWRVRAAAARRLAKRKLQTLRDWRAGLRVQGAWRRRLARRRARYVRLTRVSWSSIDRCQQRLALAKWCAFTAYAAAAARAALTLQAHMRPFLRQCRFLAFVARERKRLKEARAAHVIETHFRAYRNRAILKRLQISAVATLQRFCVGLPSSRRQRTRLRRLLLLRKCVATRVVKCWWRRHVSRTKELSIEPVLISKHFLPPRVAAPVISTRSFASSEPEAKVAVRVAPHLDAHASHEGSVHRGARAPSITPSPTASAEIPFKATSKDSEEVAPRTFGPLSGRQAFVEILAAQSNEVGAGSQPASLSPRRGAKTKRLTSATKRFEKLLVAAQKDAVEGGGQPSERKASTVALPRVKVGPAFGQRGEDAKSALKRRRAKSPSAQGGPGRAAMESSALSSSLAAGFESAHSMLPQDIRDLLSNARARRQQRAAVAEAAASLGESKATPSAATVAEGKAAPCKNIPQEMPRPPPSPLAFVIDLPKPLNPHTARSQANGIVVGFAAESPVPPPPLQPAVGMQGSANDRRRPNSAANDKMRPASTAKSSGGGGDSRANGGGDNGGSEGSSSAATATQLTQLDWLDQMQRRRKGGKKARDVGDAAPPTFANRRVVVGGVLHSAAEHFLG